MVLFNLYKPIKECDDSMNKNMELKQCFRVLSLEGIKKLNTQEKLPVSLLVTGYLLTNEEQFLNTMPSEEGRVLKVMDLNNLAAISTYQELTTKLDKQLLSEVIKELYLNVNTSEDIKVILLVFTLSEQFGITDMMGYYYDQEPIFLLSHISKTVSSEELKSLLVKKANTLELKKVLLNCEHVYFSPSELLSVTKNQELIKSYLMSHRAYESYSHLSIFKEILSKICTETLLKFNQQKNEIKGVGREGNIINFRRKKRR